MTLAIVWDLLAAAESVARAHGCEVRALLTTRRVLQVQLWRGRQLEGDAHALVEREVAQALARRGAVA